MDNCGLIADMCNRADHLISRGRGISVIAGQTMVWAIFHLLPINMKFQWAILSKFNIAISVVNGPFLLLNGSMAHGPTPAITMLSDIKSPLSKCFLSVYTRIFFFTFVLHRY